MNWSDDPQLQAAAAGIPAAQASNSTLQQLQSSSSSSGSSGSSGGQVNVDIPDAPDMPDISELTGLFAKLPSLFNTKGINKAFNSTIDTTRSEGFQAASNAGNSYAAREQQMGVNPSAAGVVEAQARAPVYSAVNDLTKDREQAKLQAHQIGASLQAQIAASIGQIRESYTNTLAQYNLGAVGLKEKEGEFNSSLGNNQFQFGQTQNLDWAKILGSGPGGSSTAFVDWLMKQIGVSREGDPGYIGNTQFDPATGQHNYNGHNVDVATI